MATDMDDLDLIRKEIEDAKRMASALSPEQRFALMSRRSDLGLIGRIFGSRDNAIVYCATLCGLLALAAYVGLLFALDDGSTRLDIAAKSLPPIVLAVLGYLFGRARADR